MINPTLRDKVAERLEPLIRDNPLSSPKQLAKFLATCLLESVPGEEPLAWEIEREILGGTAPALGQVGLIHPPKRAVRVARFIRSKCAGWIE